MLSAPVKHTCLCRVSDSVMLLCHGCDGRDPPHCVTCMRQLDTKELFVVSAAEVLVSCTFMKGTADCLVHAAARLLNLLRHALGLLVAPDWCPGEAQLPTAFSVCSDAGRIISSGTASLSSTSCTSDVSVTLMPPMPCHDAQFISL